MFWPFLKKVRCLDVLDISLWIKEKLSRRDFESFAMRTYAIRMERLRKVHNTETKEMMVNVNWSETMLCSYQKATSSLLTAKARSDPSLLPRIWIAPPVNNLRLDVDAAYNVNSNIYVIGGVVRNHKGQPLLAFGKQIIKPLSVVVAELIAIEEEIQLTLNQNLRVNQVTSDSLLAMQLVNYPTEDYGYIGAIAATIRNTLSTQGHLNLEHVLHTANRVAHFLASFAISSPSPFVCKSEDFSIWLVKLVIKDFVRYE